MLIAAAVCPHPPLLIPAATGVSGPGDMELERLRAACHAAVAALRAAAPDLIVVAGGAERTGDYPPETPGGLREFGVPAGAGDNDDRGSSAVLPLSLTIGKWLLARPATDAMTVRSEPPTAWWGIAADAPAGECLELGGKIAALAPRVALLAMGDGPGRRARGAPGARDSAADRYDEEVAAALAAPSPHALAALDPAADGELFIAGRAAWQVLAGAAGQDDFAAALAYAAAPFEVSYFVASWRRAD
ncbi:MAG: hypothetical protein ABSB76_19355 [Streptosporangiaceae bacterium]|jgi:hypothetical protein